MDHAGAVLGPLVAAVLVAAGLAVSAVVLWSAVPGLLAVAVVAWAMARVSGAPPAATPPPESRAASTTRIPRGAMALVFGFAFVRLPETLLLLRLHDLGVGVAAVPVLWAVLHVVRSAASYPGGWLSDVIGPLRTMQVGWIAYALVSAGLATASAPLVGAVWFLVFGLVAALTESPERALVAALGRAARRGRWFGAYHAGVGLAALPGALLLGVLWVRFGGPVTLAVSGGAAVLLAAAAIPPRARGT
jgi:hypothetical protein